MAGSFSTPSSTSHGSRPTMPFRASTTPDLSTRLALSSTFSKASSTQQPPAGRSSLSLASVHDLWIEGLTQYTGFRLHAALSTFKRILRELRSSEDELPSPTTSIVTCTEAPILTPEEATLLYINIGLIHGYLGSYYLSAAAFEEALLIDDASGIAWFGLGIARFYLRELGASKRAFGTCQRCFVVRDENGEKHQKEELSYRTWIGQSPPVRKPNTANEGDDPTNAPSPRQEFKGILGHGFPNGLWKLERARVEWNWRIALFERNHVRKGIERPGGGKWGLNGIPAGLIFGPNSVFESHDIAIRHRNKEEENANVSGLAVTVSQASTGEVKGRTGSLVKRKWSLLQQRVLKKPITLVPSLLHRRTKSSESFASSNYSNNEPTSIKEDDPVERASPPEVSDQYPGILKRPMPPTPPLTPYQLRGPYDDEWEKEIRKQSETSPRPKPPHAPIPCLFPPRRSSLIIPSTRYSPNHRRFLRGTLLAVNTAIQSVERIDEESPERKCTKLLVQYLSLLMSQPRVRSLLERRMASICDERRHLAKVTDPQGADGRYHDAQSDTGSS